MGFFMVTLIFTQSHLILSRSEVAWTNRYLYLKFSSFIHRHLIMVLGEFRWYTKNLRNSAEFLRFLVLRRNSVNTIPVRLIGAKDRIWVRFWDYVFWQGLRVGGAEKHAGASEPSLYWHGYFRQVRHFWLDFENITYLHNLWKCDLIHVLVVWICVQSCRKNLGL
jgi:hypothetical protein